MSNNDQYNLEREDYNIESGQDTGEYNLEDDKVEHIDLQSYESEEDRIVETHRSEDNSKKPSLILMLLYLMINPVEGWKRIRRSKVQPEEVARRCFYPMTALATVSQFMRLAYGTITEVNTLVVSALTVFISFFFGYFVVRLMQRILLPANCRKKAADSPYGQIFTMYLLSTLTIFYTISNILPMLEAIWVFLPLWTIFIASKGIRFFKFEDHRINLITALMCAFEIGAPILVFMIFTELLAI